MGIAYQPAGGVPIADPLQQRSKPDLRHVEIALHFRQRDRMLRQGAIRAADAFGRVLPPLVRQTFSDLVM